MQKWEYLHIKLERKPWNEEDSSFIQREHGVDLDELGFEFYMKDLGMEGWELVSAFPVGVSRTLCKRKRNYIARRPSKRMPNWLRINCQC